MQTTDTTQAATEQTVELCDNELRAFFADMARLSRTADSVRFSIGSNGMKMSIDGGGWTPAFGYVSRQVPA